MKLLITKLSFLIMIALLLGCYQPLRDTETTIVDVTNPITGRTWMDRNLGASRAATSMTDEQAYGDLYQWGRGADGHQKRNSDITTTLSNSDQPGHDLFILSNVNNSDWRDPQNNELWQGVNGINNPCPSGYRLPTEDEWNAEMNSWDSKNAEGAFASPLKLTTAGWRVNYSASEGHGNIRDGTSGKYWASDPKGFDAVDINFFLERDGYTDESSRGDGLSVRCLKDES